MTNEPYDACYPPAEPPDGCSDPLLWRVAYALRVAHPPRPDGFCECRVFWPCPTVKFADQALGTAYDRPWGRSSRSSTSNIGRWSA